MKVFHSIFALQRLLKQVFPPLVLVPTMGALHRGHAALIDRARALAGKQGTVVVSIFVNPTQFGPREDFTRYPRQFTADRKLCEAHGVDVIFNPSAPEVYPDGFSTFVEEEKLSLRLCGASRPGHFRGVCTIVLKLFAIVQPQIAVFGLKDYQQCAVIRRMVSNLNLPVRIATLSTVREPDGLALSSRNRYLSPAQRRQAPIIRAALLEARKACLAGELNATRLRRLVARNIQTASLARLDYIEIADSETLEPVREVRPSTLIAVAVYFGKTRLIDNLRLR